MTARRDHNPHAPKETPLRHVDELRRLLDLYGAYAGICADLRAAIADLERRRTEEAA